MILKNDSNILQIISSNFQSLFFFSLSREIPFCCIIKKRGKQVIYSLLA